MTETIAKSPLLKDRLSLEEAARELNISRNTLDKYISLGGIEKKRIGRRMYIRREDLESWLDEG